MLRTMYQAYVIESKKAVETYIEAFDGKIVSSYSNESGGYYHCEINIEGTILAISESDESNIDFGDNMQLCFHYLDNEKDKIKKAYEVLKKDATIFHELGECGYSPLMADLIDKFGVRWCLFI